MRLPSESHRRHRAGYGRSVAPSFGRPARRGFFPPGPRCDGFVFREVSRVFKVKGEGSAKGVGAGKRFPRRLTVRLTEEELAVVTERAARARLSLSRYAATCSVRGKLPPLRDCLPPDPKDRAQIEGLVYEIRKAGVNLNQLARRRNRAAFDLGTAPSATETERAAGLAARLLRLLRNRL